MQRLRRSCLAVPGSSPKMIARALELPADQVFLDLEDSVAVSEKHPGTRDNIVQALLRPGWSAATRVVRVNAVGTPWCMDDVVHVVNGAGDSLHCIMLPKVETAAEVHFVDHLLRHLERRLGLSSQIGLEIQIESPRGLLNVEAIAASSGRIEALIFGPGDYAAAAGVPQLTVGAIEARYPGDQWHYVRSRLVTTARAFGLQAIDGPYAAIRDLEGYRETAMHARLLGFDGKWALHPDQIEPSNEIYSPSSAEFERAQEILEAYAGATLESVGAALLDQEMIDEATRKMAEQVVVRGHAAGMGDQRGAS